MIIRRLVWDDWNIEHIAKHNVEPEEVEEVCSTKRKLVTKVGDDKIRVIAQTLSGRYLTVFLAYKGKGSYYVVTARDSGERERRRLKRK